MTYAPLLAVPPKFVPSGGAYVPNLNWLGGATAMSFPVGSTLYAAPAVYCNRFTIDALVAEVTVAFSGGAGRVGIYADNGNYLPGSLITEFTSAAQMDTTATGQKTITTSFTFQPGVLYWWASACSTTGASWRSGGTPAWPSISRNLSEATNIPGRYAYEWGYGGGALPATWTGAQTAAGTGGGLLVSMHTV